MITKLCSLEHITKILCFLSIFINLILFTDCYRGLYRQQNGTAVELFKIFNNVCEKVHLGLDRYDIPDLPEYCGYKCNTDFDRTSTVYNISDSILSPGCGLDTNILSNEKCSVSIGTTWNQKKINTFTVQDIDKQFVSVNQKQASRCTLKDDCSVKYRNITSGWQTFLYDNCFKFVVLPDNNIAKAQIQIDCVRAHQNYLGGHLFRLELDCHVDTENVTYESCLLFKIPGVYIENTNKSVLSSNNLCMITPTPVVTPTVTPTSQTGDDDDFMNPNGYIIIGVVILVILLVLIILLCIYCKRKKNYDVDGKSQKAANITAGGVFPVLSVKHGGSIPTHSKQWLQLDDEEVTVDTTPTQERKEKKKEEIPVSEFLAKRSIGFENPLFDAESESQDPIFSPISTKEVKPAMLTPSSPFLGRPRALTPPISEHSTSFVNVEYAKVNKPKKEQSHIEKIAVEEPHIYEEMPNKQELQLDNQNYDHLYVKSRASSVNSNSSSIYENSDVDEFPEKPMSENEANLILSFLDDGPRSRTPTIIIEDTHETFLSNDNKDHATESTLDNYNADTEGETFEPSSISGDDLVVDNNFEKEENKINMPDSVLKQIIYWKSKALKRTDSRKQSIFRNGAERSSSSDLSDKESKQNTLEEASFKDKPKPEKPKRTKKSIKSDGTLLNVAFDNYNSDHGHIYYNNSSVVVTEPLSKYVQPTEDIAFCESSDSKDDADSSSEKSFGSSAEKDETKEDFDFSHNNGSIENGYKVPVPIHKEDSSFNDENNIYNVPSPPVLNSGAQKADDVFEFDWNYKKPTHEYDEPDNNDYNQLPTRDFLRPPMHQFNPEPHLDQPIYDQPPNHNDEPAPQLPKKENNLSSDEEDYDTVTWPPIAAFSSDSNSNFYNVVPQIKGDTKESVTINFRRPVPSDIELTRLPYSQFNYGMRNTGSGNSSCNGFCLCIANYFLNHDPFSISQLEESLPALLKESESIWKELGIGSTTVEEACKNLQNVYNADFSCILGEESFWSIDQGLGGNSPYEALHELYYSSVNSPKKECLIFTFYPDRSCICLFDDSGTQYFIDAHIHFKTNNQDRKDALSDHECGGVIARTVSGKSDVLLNFILTNMCLEMKANAKNGTAFPVYKNSPVVYL